LARSENSGLSIKTCFVTRSAYFSGIFGLTERQEETYLENEDPLAFAKFVDWMYGSPVRTITNCNRIDDDDEEDVKAHLLVEIFLLADSLGVRNEIMDFFTGRFNDSSIYHFRFDDVKTIYSRSLPESKIRELLVAYAACLMFNKKRAKDYMDDLFKELPDFTFEVLKAAQDLYSSDPEDKNHLRLKPLCKYHTHLRTPNCK